MLIDAIYDNGRLLLPKQFSFAHQRFNIKVELPDTEIVEKNIAACNPASARYNDDNLGATDELSSLIVAISQYPAEYVEFEKLQDALFGKDYVYKPEKSDQEILAEALSEKYA